jgi:hypothetical protein
MAKKCKPHIWQEKQKKAGRITLTFFCEQWIKDKIFARAAAKDMSVADYLNKYLPKIWKKKEKVKEEIPTTKNQVLRLLDSPGVKSELSRTLSQAQR